MKPDQDPEHTPSREAAATKGRVGPGPAEPREAGLKGRVTSVPPERSPDDRADDRGEGEDVSRREALKGRVDPVSTESAPAGTGDPDRNGDRAGDGAGSAVRPAGTGTTSSRATTGAGVDERGAAPADGRAGRTGAGPVSPVPHTSGTSDDGPGPRPVSRDAAGAHPRGGPADTQARGRAFRAAGRRPVPPRRPHPITAAR
ncbi:hypothetical protein ACFWJM_38345, partial [Streptomyces sp. NPDC127077]